MLLLPCCYDYPQSVPLHPSPSSSRPIKSRIKLAPSRPRGSINLPSLYFLRHRRPSICRSKKQKKIGCTRSLGCLPTVLSPISRRRTGNWLWYVFPLFSLYQAIFLFSFSRFFVCPSTNVFFCFLPEISSRYAAQFFFSSLELRII